MTTFQNLVPKDGAQGADKVEVMRYLHSANNEEFFKGDGTGQCPLCHVQLVPQPATHARGCQFPPIKEMAADGSGVGFFRQFGQNLHGEGQAPPVAQFTVATHRLIDRKFVANAALQSSSSSPAQAAQAPAASSAVGMLPMAGRLEPVLPPLTVPLAGPQSVSMEQQLLSALRDLTQSNVNVVKAVEEVSAKMEVVSAKMEVVSAKMDVLQATILTEALGRARTSEDILPSRVRPPRCQEMIETQFGYDVHGREVETTRDVVAGRVRVTLGRQDFSVVRSSPLMYHLKCTGQCAFEFKMTRVDASERFVVRKVVAHERDCENVIGPRRKKLKVYLTSSQLAIVARTTMSAKELYTFFRQTWPKSHPSLSTCTRVRNAVRADALERLILGFSNLPPLFARLKDDQPDGTFLLRSKPSFDAVNRRVVGRPPFAA
jgi:hypothetical protein